MEREQHSADWTSYIEKIDERRWRVVFRGVDQGVQGTREKARHLIRSLKGASGPPFWVEDRFTRILSALEVEEAAGRSSERV